MSPEGCAVCGTLASLVCGDCKSATYCSGVCQKKDHALHDLLCGKLKVFIEKNPRPVDIVDGTMQKLGLLFSENPGTEPDRYALHTVKVDFIWVQTNCTFEDDESCEVLCDLSQIYDKEAPVAIKHKRHDRTIQVWTSGEDSSYD
jgi:hypothetical protein